VEDLQLGLSRVWQNQIVATLRLPDLAVSTCPLCEARKATKRFYDGPECWCALCLRCQVPMVVLRKHDDFPTIEIRQICIKVLRIAAQAHYEKKPFWIDFERRSIKGHWHAHARPGQVPKT